jgi:hypothetical protein
MRVNLSLKAILAQTPILDFLLAFFKIATIDLEHQKTKDTVI